MATPEGTRLVEGDLVEIKKAYSDFDTNRPPFRFPTREKNYQSEPSYAEVDETQILEMEDRVFHPQATFPHPPEDLAEDHPVKKAWSKLMEAEAELMSGVEMIKTIKKFLEDGAKTQTGEPVSAPVLKMLGVINPGGKGGMERLEKSNREDHLRKKKEYFQRAMCYLYLYKNCPDFPEKAAVTDDLLDETELICLGHIGYAAVRSGAHKFGAVREDGTLVMDHCYKTSVYVINRYLEELRLETDPKKRRGLYNQVKKGVLVAIPHDYKEDFVKLLESFLEDKLTQQTTWHTDIEGDLRMPGYQGIPPRSNFFTRNKRGILRMLRALTKPPKGDPLRAGYLERNLKEEWDGSITDQVLCFRVKVGDRLHNVRSVNIKPIPKQADYMIETGKIIDLGRELATGNKKRGALSVDVQVLINTTIETSTNLLAVTGQVEEPIRTDLGKEVQRIRALLGALKKAA